MSSVEVREGHVVQEILDTVGIDGALLLVDIVRTFCWVLTYLKKEIRNP